MRRTTNIRTELQARRAGRRRVYELRNRCVVRPKPDLKHCMFACAAASPKPPLAACRKLRTGDLINRRLSTDGQLFSPMAMVVIPPRLREPNNITAAAKRAVRPQCLATTFIYAQRLRHDPTAREARCNSPDVSNPVTHNWPRENYLKSISYCYRFFFLWSLACGNLLASACSISGIRRLPHFLSGCPGRGDGSHQGGRGPALQRTGHFPLSVRGGGRRALLWPGGVTALNLSVGLYRIKDRHDA